MELLGEPTPTLSQENTRILETSHTTRQDGMAVGGSRDHDVQSIFSMSERSLVSGGTGGSLTWVSDDTRERDSFRRMRLNVGHMSTNSPFVPVDMNGWLTHRLEIVEDNMRKLNRAILLRRTEKASACNDNIRPALEGRRLGDFRSTVLAQKTIWRPDELNNPSRPQAPWPDSSERKHEGYQRVRSGYSRFPPLPRVPGNPTVNWKQRSPIAAYEFDQVGRPVILKEVPTENDPNTESMIGESLLKEIDA